VTDIKDGANYAPSSEAKPVVAPGEFCYAAAYLDHGHIYGQTNGLRDAGGTLRWVYDPDPARVQKFADTYPGVKIADSFEQILADPEIRLVTAAAVPDQRAAIGTRVLEAGKDYFTDKSPFTNLAQLESVREVVSRSGRKYAVYYAERLHNDAAWHAGELIAQGAVGRVLQVLNLAPHRLAKSTRPEWFFDKSRYGGILTDIGSHQVEQFLTYAGCSDATVNFARVENFSHPDKPGLEDFGEISLTGDNGASFYTRVDWYTPEGLRTWGDDRRQCRHHGIAQVYRCGRRRPLVETVTGERGRGAGHRLQGPDRFSFLRAVYTGLPARQRKRHDPAENAMTQQHCFKAAELSMRAQQLADQRRTG
jgi:predicted dehydrogenase